ncbi:hypothetical protein PMSD_25755 [Paenibacillus macquariensis subsp. defensor]|nr:hypothetical protein PMSD_25755 [Paenibacillus macquariensis subsp. defensor]
MYDPTVYENLKVAFENTLYDLDNLDGIIHISHRMDRMEMSVMSREFAIQFVLAEHREISAEIALEASLQDLAAEILELPGENPACTLRLRFVMEMENVETQCDQIAQLLPQIWESSVTPTQTLSYVYGQERMLFTNTIEVRFQRKINEDQMEDVPEVVDHVIRTLIGLKDLQ